MWKDVHHHYNNIPKNVLDFLFLPSPKDSKAITEPEETWQRVENKDLKQGKLVL